MRELENLKRDLDEMTDEHATITVSRKDLELVVKLVERLLNEKKNKEDDQ